MDAYYIKQSVVGQKSNLTRVNDYHIYVAKVWKTIAISNSYLFSWSKLATEIARSHNLNFVEHVMMVISLKTVLSL